MNERYMRFPGANRMKLRDGIGPCILMVCSKCRNRVRLARFFLTIWIVFVTILVFLILLLRCLSQIPVHTNRKF